MLDVEPAARGRRNCAKARPSAPRKKAPRGSSRKPARAPPPDSPTAHRAAKESATTAFARLLDLAEKQFGISDRPFEQVFCRTFVPPAQRVLKIKQ